MEAVVLPLGPYGILFYRQSVRPLRKYLIDTLFLKDDDEFDEVFALSESNDYVTFTKRDEYGRNAYKKRFKKGRAAILSIDEIDELRDYVSKKRIEIQLEKNVEIKREKAEKLLKKLLEKYSEDNEDENDGFSIEFNAWRVDYESSIYIRYKPLDDLNLQDSRNYYFTGYYKVREGDDEDSDRSFEDTYIPSLDMLPEQEIIALLNKEDTFYDFVITKYEKIVNRLRGDVVNMYILRDGILTIPEFELSSDWQTTLDNIIKLSDKCIEWQIEIMEFAEKLKSEINPKFFELYKS